jgi:signal transduction histidine kinase
LNGLWGEDFPFIFYFPVTLFTGLYGGFGPALLSIGITSTATLVWVFPPIGRLPVMSPTVVQGLVVYLFVEIIIATMGSRHRHVLNQRRQAERAKDVFLANVSHELRTPLTPILLTTSILENERTLSPAVRSAFDVIARNVQLQARMVNDLLDVSRVINRKLDLELTQCDLPDIIERALCVCVPDGTAKNLKITTKFDARQKRVLGDATRLEQLFWNLIQNAIKFTPSDGSITIHSRDANGQVQIDVSDSGCGIEPAKLQTIFEPFEQVESGVDLQHGRRGLGVGLAIARQIAIAHGGTLFAASDGLNRGSTFTVSLPATLRPSS